MPPQHRAALVQDVSGRKGPSGPARQEGGVIPVRHKADILALLLLGGDEAALLRKAPHLRFGKLPQGKAQMGELPLAQGVEHIALILALIQGLAQFIAPGLPVLGDAGVMAGDKTVKAPLQGQVQQGPELQEVVTVDAGVGGLAAFIGLGEAPDHGGAKDAGEVQGLVGDAQLKADIGRILRVPVRAAALVASKPQIPAAVQPHGDALAGIARALHQQGGGGAVLVEIKEDGAVGLLPGGAVVYRLDTGSHFIGAGCLAGGVGKAYTEKGGLTVSHTPARRRQPISRGGAMMGGG